ncbi:hypothetical protein FRB97_007569 [Tulasnella sp. 331]|nr:hypothetical protein FRB97_007569 [Tulasnella sp. 331]
MPFGPSHTVILHTARWALASFFQEIRIVNEQNVPKDGPVLVVCTHHNMVVDPATLSATFPHGRYIHYWSKSSLFVNPIAKWILLDSGNIPVNRKSKDNQTMFKGTFDVLSLGEVVALFPEGTSYTEPKIMQVKDGAAWAALEYTKWATGEEGVKKGAKPLTLLPAGLVYTNKSKYRSSAVIEYGKPIPLAALAEEFALDDTNSKKSAVKKLTKAIERDLFRMTINAEDWETLYASRMARELLWEGKPVNLDEFVSVSQMLVDLLTYPSPSISTSTLKSALLKYSSLLNASKLTNEAISALPLPRTLDPDHPTPLPSRLSTLAFLIGSTVACIAPLPFFAIPLIVNIPVYVMSRVGARLALNEEETIAQNKIAFGLILTTSTYSLLFLGIWAFLWLTPTGAVMAAGAVYLLWTFYSRTIDDFYARAKRMLAAWRVLIGVWGPRRWEMSSAALKPFTVPEIPAASEWIDKPLANNVTTTDGSLTAVAPSTTPTGAKPATRKLKSPKAPRPASRSLIRHVLRARIEASRALAAFMEELDCKSPRVRVSAQLGHLEGSIEEGYVSGVSSSDAGDYLDAGKMSSASSTGGSPSGQSEKRAYLEGREIVNFLRSRAIKEVCKLLPSNHASVNSQATIFLANVFPDFIDLQETIINVAYDMVEAEESQREVRYAGYRFISALTKKVPSWARRNVDVLVQLLALDEPEDLRQLNNALADHIDVDPTLTLTVLCMYLKVGNEKSSVASTEDLRIKILSFLQQCATKDRYIEDSESTTGFEYRIGIINALSTALRSEAQTMVENLLLPIPLSPDNAGSLMEVLVEKAHSMLQSELEHQENAMVSLEDIIVISELANQVFNVVKSCPPESALLALAFYSSSEILSIRPQLPPGDQVLLVERMADYAQACMDRADRLPQPLLTACMDRVSGDCAAWAKCQNDKEWKPNEVSLNRLMDRLSGINFPRVREREGREAQSIIRNVFDILHSPSPVTPLPVSTAVSAPAPRAPVVVPIIAPLSTMSAGKRKMDVAPPAVNTRPTADSLNPIPVAPTASPITGGQTPKAFNDGQLPQVQTDSSSFRTQNLLARLSLKSPVPDPTPSISLIGQPTAVNVDMETDDGDRPMKRRKMADRLNSTPSLLARLGTNAVTSTENLGRSMSDKMVSSNVSQSSTTASAITAGVKLTGPATLPRKPLLASTGDILPPSDQRDNTAGQSRPSLGKGSSTATVTTSPIVAQTSDNLSQTLPPPRPSLSIAGAASFSNASAAKAVEKPPVVAPVSSFSIKGAASGNAGSGSQSHGAVSFQRALASIVKPSKSLDSLNPFAQQETIPTPPPPHPRPKPAPAIPIRTPTSSSASLLARLTNGVNLQEKGRAAIVTPAPTPRTLSERMQMGAVGSGMDVDGIAQPGNRKRKSGRGR